MNESNVERMRELLNRATESAEAMKHESDNNMCALYQTNIVRFNKAIDKTAPALLEIARHATDLVNSCDHCGGTKDDQWPCVKCSELKAAIAKFNSLKIEGL